MDKFYNGPFFMIRFTDLGIALVPIQTGSPWNIQKFSIEKKWFLNNRCK